ncbi:MAG TPA: helix-turn-helix transcriptional regulator, partial [Bacteroidia bacterium]|nr:helix-turn-helix transcriptional regulator [Bacteroidia bacterium]
QVPDAIYTLFKYEYHFVDMHSIGEDYPENKSHLKTINGENVTVITKELFDEQEKIILRYICEGLSSKQIGEKMFLSYRTVQNKRLKLHAKTKTKSVAKLIEFISKNKII